MSDSQRNTGEWFERKAAKAGRVRRTRSRNRQLMSAALNDNLSDDNEQIFGNVHVNQRGNRIRVVR
jgi:hypothetical protein